MEFKDAQGHELQAGDLVMAVRSDMAGHTFEVSALVGEDTYYAPSRAIVCSSSGSGLAVEALEGTRSRVWQCCAIVKLNNQNPDEEQTKCDTVIPACPLS